MRHSNNASSSNSVNARLCNAGESSYASYQNVSATSNGRSLGDDEDEVATLDTALYEMKVMGNGNSSMGSTKRSNSNVWQNSTARNATSTHRLLSANNANYSFHNSSHQIVLLSKAKKKSLEMTATVSICFAVCWLPYCVTMLFITFNDGGEGIFNSLIGRSGSLIHLAIALPDVKIFLVDSRGRPTHGR